MLMNANEYLETVEQVKQEIRTAQYRAAVQVNCELLRLYHAIGTVINAHKVWGSRFVENLAADIKLSFPEMKGYSVRNLKYMAKFAEAYSADEFVQQPVAQIPWGHNITLLDKLSDNKERLWCTEKIAENGPHRPPRRCCRPVVHGRFRGNVAGCAGGLPRAAERINYEEVRRKWISWSFVEQKSTCSGISSEMISSV